jgi:hypothetical protein
MTRIRSLTIVLVLLLAGLAPAAPAAADSASPGGDIAVAQTLGDRDLTLILRRVTSVPGPLRVEAVTHAGTAAGSLTLVLTPVSGRTATSRATVLLGGDPGSYGATLRVDRAGPWELAVSDGVRTARVPFVVLGPAVSPPERAIYGGFLAAGLLLLVTILVAVRVRRAGWALLPGAGMVAALAVAITGAVLSASLPLPPQPGLQTDATVGNAADPYALSRPLIADYSRPPVLLSLSFTGRAGDLTLSLSDASTGLPVDDLVVHDSALIHLLIVGPAGQLWHVHPIRVAPGVYQVPFAPPGAGHYAVSAELERRGGGVQLVRAGLDATGASGSSPAYVPVAVIAGRRVTTTVSGVPVSILAASATTGTATTGTATTGTATTGTATTGTATTLTVTIGADATLQPWLGMLGHLIVAGPLRAGVPVGTAVQTAPIWAHVHSMGDLTPGMTMPGTTMPGTTMPGMSAGTDDSMAGLMPVNGDSAVDETVAAYGPSISFTFTFGTPGTYRLWIQAERDYRILTVPAVLEVRS